MNGSLSGATTFSSPILRVLPDMASADEGMQISMQGPPPPPPAPHRNLRRSWSTNSTASAVPKCVCAPATHQGSFKCRLHRAGSHGRSSRAATRPQSLLQPAASSSAI
ncbi:hypothetical protein ACMD2_05545 [Ananas comosus]|uniref:Uncharacterized protein n=1 Tax=Ananas comosus TaxID=4615 RepID=A0A199VIY1_ANACO|nr:hypothetical protein ACMD2_05545 [Ananas comosus]